MSSNKQKVFIIKGSAPGARRLAALRLRHPRSGQAAAFLLDTTSAPAQLLQLLDFDSGPRSWLVGSCVETDGLLSVATPFDPLFLVLPYLQQSRHAQQLDQLLEDSDWPDLVRLTAALDPARVALIAESRGDPELQAYRYSEERTLTWLETKTQRLAAVLETRGLHGNTGKSENFVKVGQTEVQKEAYLKLAWGITSDYLGGDLSAALRRRLQLPEPAVKQRAAEPGPPAEKRRRVQPLQPLEDYSGAAALNKQASTPQNAKQKALAKSAVGSKNIMSFFKKK